MRQMWSEETGQLEVRMRPLFEVDDDDVLVKVAYTGICPWDVRAFSGKSSVPFPRVLGHECAVGLLEYFICLVDGTGHALFGWGEHDVGAH